MVNDIMIILQRLLSTGKRMKSSIEKNQKLL